MRIAYAALSVAGICQGLAADTFVTMPVGVTGQGYSTTCGKVLVDDQGQGLMPSGHVYRIWDRATGTMLTLPPTPAGYNSLSPFGMSHDATVVVGRAWVTATNRAHPMRCVISSGVWQDLGLPPNKEYGEAFVANGDGSTVGGGAGAGEVEEAMVWTAATGPTVFPQPYGTDPARITGFSSDGSALIGALADFFPLSGGSVSWYWTAAGGLQRIEPTSLENITPVMLSRNGQRVLCRTWTLPSTYGAFLWSPVTGRENIPLPPGVTSLYPYGVSDDGNTVVGTATLNGVEVITPWVWRRGWGHFFVGEWLKATLPESALQFWTLTDVTAVSADGNEVIGLGSYKPSPSWSARPRGWALTLPAPCVPDMGRAAGLIGGDGVLNNNDLVAFIDLFFAQEARADIGAAGGAPGPDGAWDNNDFVVFIAAFFAGCN